MDIFLNLFACCFSLFFIVRNRKKFHYNSALGRNKKATHESGQCKNCGAAWCDEARNKKRHTKVGNEKIAAQPNAEQSDRVGVSERERERAARGQRQLQQTKIK